MMRQDIMTHELKILPEYYNAVVSGRKMFEIRKNDRDLKEEDIIKLREFRDGKYTGNYAKAFIDYILHGGIYGLEEGYCMLSINVYAYGNEDIS